MNGAWWLCAVAAASLGTLAAVLDAADGGVRFGLLSVGASLMCLAFLPNDVVRRARGMIVGALLASACTALTWMILAAVLPPPEFGMVLGSSGVSIVAVSAIARGRQ